jgi:hypothetical protein
MYFGAGNFETSIDYLNKIINKKVDLRNDLQCYARLLHLIAHFELGNYNLLEYLTKSVYRFMAKLQNLSKVEENIFEFLKKALVILPTQINKELKKLHDTLSLKEHKRFETRTFMYLDIISWLESKLNNVPVQTIIAEKFKAKQ